MIQEKIQKKAEGFGKLAPVFLEGANFVLENQWISAKDDLPCNHQELIDSEMPICTLYVLVIFENGLIDISRMVKDTKGNWGWLSNIIYWLPIPKPPKNRRLDYDT